MAAGEVNDGYTGHATYLRQGTQDLDDKIDTSHGIADAVYWPNVGSNNGCEPCHARRPGPSLDRMGVRRACQGGGRNGGSGALSRVGNEVFQYLLAGLRPAMSYCDANTIEDMWANSRFVRQTNSGSMEAGRD